MSKLNESMEKHLQMLDGAIMEYPWDKPEYYAVWMSQTYFYSRHTTRLLALAGAHCKQNENDFHLRFLEHSREEKGHEKLLSKDMAAFDLKAEDFPEFTTSAALYQTQYYWIQNDSPLSFFGYVLALEVMGARYGARLHKKIEDAQGKKATHFVRVHSTEDIGHTEKALANIAKLPPEVQDKVQINMEQTFFHYTNLLKECIAYAQSMKQLKKAA